MILVLFRLEGLIWSLVVGLSGVLCCLGHLVREVTPRLSERFYRDLEV